MDKEIYKTNLISLTPKALERLRFLLKGSEEKDNAIRLGVKNGGCAGMAYTLDYIKDVGSNDEVIKIEDVIISIDNSAILFLLGTEMDYEETTLNSGFVFNNPNQVDACGCGESVTLEQAEIPVEFSEKFQK